MPYTPSYKLNRDKSEVKALNIHCTKEVLGNSGLAWQPNHIKYLGIEFGNTLMDTLLHNESVTLSKIKTLLDAWSPRFITWWGRAETTKMMVSPIVNYLIAMLPLRLSNDFHHKLDIMLNKFLWSGKKARISLKKLRLDKSLGGLNLTDFRLFQTASLARQGFNWISHSESYYPVWLNVEQAILSGIPPAALLTTNLKSAPYSQPIFKNTKLALLQLDKFMDVSVGRSGMVSIWNNSKILYKGKHLFYSTWINKGIYFTHQLYRQDQPLSFRELQDIYSLNSSEFYNFLKIKVAMSKAHLTNSPPSLVQHILTLNRVGHHISKSYKLIRPQHSSLNKNTSFWESQTPYPITDSDWSAVWTSTMKNKISPSLSQAKFWLLHRAFWTPVRLFKHGIRDTPTCWNCNKETGDLEHLLLHCSCVSVFWTKIFDFLHQLFAYSPTREFHSLAFGFLRAEPLNDSDRALLDLLLTAAVKIILSNWKETGKATFNHWINWVAHLRGADNISLQNSPWKSPDRHMWDSLDRYFKSYKPP